MEFTFNIRGHLTPYEIIETDLPTFKAEFVDNFGEDSTRHAIFEKYLTYLEELKQITSTNFIQWIDGSFISTKINPKDIDLVSVVDYEDYEKNITKIANELIAHNARKLYEVDAYMIPNYPQNHKKHIITQSDLLYWRELFGNTRANRSKKQFPKGIIQLNFMI